MGSKVVRPNGQGQFTGLRGQPRLEVMRLHRLLIFQQSFDLYLKGECPAAYVTARWLKLKEVGLHKLR